MHRPQLLMRPHLLGLLLIAALAAPPFAVAEEKAAAPDLPTVAVLGMGGTIAQKYDPVTHASVPAVSADDLTKNIPGLDKVAKLQVEEIMNIDSSQAKPDDWLKLAKRVNEVLKDPAISGVVVVHGTDTMEEGVFLVDRLLDSNKPVVFVGAMRNASELGADGPRNLRDAITVAAAPEFKDCGAMLAMNSHVSPAKGVRKSHTINPQTFVTGEEGNIGYVTAEGPILFHKPVRAKPIPMPDKLPKVDVIPSYSGSDGRLAKYAVESGAEGLVVEGVGAGNVNEATYEGVKLALAKKLPVVVTSRVYYGEVLPIYGGPGGGHTLKEDGVIFPGRLTTAQARILLLLTMTQTTDPAELQTYFDEPAANKE